MANDIANEIINDHVALKEEEKGYKPIPIIRQVDNAMVQRNYLQIKQEVQDIVDSEMDRMSNDPMLAHLIVNKTRRYWYYVRGCIIN